MKRLMIPLFCLLLLSSCGKEEIISTDFSIEGTWSFKEIEHKKIWTVGNQTGFSSIEKRGNLEFNIVKASVTFNANGTGNFDIESTNILWDLLGQEFIWDKTNTGIEITTADDRVYQWAFVEEEQQPLLFMPSWKIESNVAKDEYKAVLDRK